MTSMTQYFFPRDLFELMALDHKVLLEKQVLRYLGEIDSQACGRKPFVTEKRYY
jgi:hypothetical protein